jgi:hypothetical protein
MKKGMITKKVDVTVSPTKNSGLSLKDSKWISPEPKVIEVNESNTPNTGRYLVIPKSAPNLQSRIRAGDWDVMNKTLNVSITETNDLFVLEWLAAVNSRRKAAEKSPFPDFEHDQIALIFLTGDNNRIVGLKLKGIELMSHKSSFGGTPKHLTHEVVFKYENTEKIVFNVEDKPSPPDNELADEEWSTVELEIKTK